MNRIGVLGNPEYEGVPRALARIWEQARDRGIELLVDEELGGDLPKEATFLPERASDVDLLITLGGDGTLLRGARWAAPDQVPVLGVNLGRLGFLTAASLEDLDSLIERLSQGAYEIDERMTLEVQDENQTILALNDAVLHKSGFARVVMLRIRVDGQEVGLYAADGVIIATPTGSTAYSLSAGGPILDPRLDAILTTPICPHTLAVRPLVLPPDAEVGIEVLSPEEELVLTIDGQVGSALKPGDRVVARRSDLTVRLVRWPGQSFFTTLRRKLGWGDLKDRTAERPNSDPGS